MDRSVTAPHASTSVVEPAGGAAGALPSISIVTPSLNQGPFIRATIESVLSQRYPRLEYLVQDGGSSDATLRILGEYRDRLAMDSRPDRGQSHAINFAMAHTTGEVVSYLNSDDLLLPGALDAVGAAFADDPRVSVVFGGATYIDSSGETIRRYDTRADGFAALERGCFIAQPAVFMRREVWEDTDGLDEHMHYCMDYDHWFRIAARVEPARIRYLDRPLAASRIHAGAKTVAGWNKTIEASIAIVRRYTGLVPIDFLAARWDHAFDGRSQLTSPHPLPLRAVVPAVVDFMRGNPPRTWPRAVRFALRQCWPLPYGPRTLLYYGVVWSAPVDTTGPFPQIALRTPVEVPGGTSPTPAPADTAGVRIDARRTSRGRYRIGLLLNTNPHDGGVFGVCQAMLQAVAALPRDRYDVVALYLHKHVWQRQVAQAGVPALEVRPNQVSDLFCGELRWRAIALPIPLLRLISPLVHPVARGMARSGCDIWICPAQDHWTYAAPVPTLGFIADLMHRHERGYPEVSGRRAYRERERHFSAICRWGRGVLVDSELGRQHVHEAYGVPEDRLHVLPWRVPPHVTGRPASHFDDRYVLPAKYLFYPAQFWLHKNHARLFEALAIARRDCPDIRLVLAGGRQNGFEPAMRRAAELGVTDAIVHLGYVPDADIGEFYRRARALIMPSVFGPTNMPPIEAFATGCPVAASDVYAAREQLGDAALLFDPHDAADMARCITRLWQDDALCAGLARKGSARASTWTAAHHAARLADHLNRVLADARRPAAQG